MSLLRQLSRISLAGAGATTALATRAHAQSNEGVPVPYGRKGWVVTPLLKKVAVVTGSSQGIGAGIAMELAHAGADVCINYVGPRADADEVAGAVRAIGRRAIVVEADVSDRAAVEKMFDATEAALGPVDILVTNAVMSTRNNLLETKPEDFDRTLKIGIYGVFHCMQVRHRASTRGR